MLQLTFPTSILAFTAFVLFKLSSLANTIQRIAELTSQNRLERMIKTNTRLTKLQGFFNNATQ